MKHMYIQRYIYNKQNSIVTTALIESEPTKDFLREKSILPLTLLRMCYLVIIGS